MPSNRLANTSVISSPPPSVSPIPPHPPPSSAPLKLNSPKKINKQQPQHPLTSLSRGQDVAFQSSCLSHLISNTSMTSSTPPYHPTTLNPQYLHSTPHPISSLPPPPPYYPPIPPQPPYLLRPSTPLPPSQQNQQSPTLTLPISLS